MTAIIDYGERPEYLLWQLEKLGVNLKFTSVESEILSAEKIILPDCHDLKKAIKRLHLLNLFSMLRMIKKPVLGIGNGVSIMCENTHEPGKTGLGFFPLSLTVPSEVPPLPAKMSADICDNVIFMDAVTLDGLYFEKLFLPSSNEFNAAVLTDHNEIPAAFKKGNYMGVVFSPAFSGPAGNLFLNKFIEI